MKGKKVAMCILLAIFLRSGSEIWSDGQVYLIFLIWSQKTCFRTVEPNPHPDSFPTDNSNSRLYIVLFHNFIIYTKGNRGPTGQPLQRSLLGCQRHAYYREPQPRPTWNYHPHLSDPIRKKIDPKRKEETNNNLEPTVDRHDIDFWQGQ